MGLVTDAAYAVAATVTMPLWFVRMATTGKLRTDWRGRFGDAAPWPRSAHPRILIHAVSVGEAAAIRHLVGELSGAPEEPEIVISATTDTGIERARSLYAAQHRIVRYPFDFGRCVRRFLDAVRPDLVALTELEVWPNFVAECGRRGIPVAVVNGRLSERSEGRYRLLRPVLARSFRSLALVAAQSEAYADRFRAMGVPADRVVRAGTMKWDTAEIADVVEGAEALAQSLGIDRTKPLVVAGSTAPGEESLLLQSLPPGVQLLCAPRRPEWFDAAERALPGCVRRSRVAADGAAGGAGATAGGSAAPRTFLLDTIGELRRAYALADLVVVGRTLEIGGRFGGSDMMEPVALGKAVIVGPDVANFRETVEQLAAAGGLVQCTAEALAGELRRLLADPAARRALAERGRQVIRSQQGASRRSAELLLRILREHPARRADSADRRGRREAIHA